MIGEEAGPKKLETIKKLHIKTLDEKQFYELVRELPAKTEASSKVSEMISEGKVPLSPTKKTHKPVMVKKVDILKTIIPTEEIEEDEDSDDMLLVDKYAPKRVQDIIGNQTIISQTVELAEKLDRGCQTRKG